MKKGIVMKQTIALVLAITTLYSVAKETASSAQIKQRKLVVTNNISPEMTTYHFMGAHRPEFACWVNNAPVEHGKSVEVPIINNQLVVRYRYNFNKGYYKGAKEVTFEVAPDKKECALQFSWNNSSRITASGAKPKTIKKVNFSS